jgi:hypothetical protein
MAPRRRTRERRARARAQRTTEGGFGKALSVALGEPPLGIAAVDLDGDGHLDLVGTGAGTQLVWTARNDGRGALSPPWTTRAPSPVECAAAGDLDGDGKPDLIAAGGAGVVWFFGNAGGGFLGQPWEVLRADRPNSIALADLDGDGRLDLAVTCMGPGEVKLVLSGGAKPPRP